MSWTSQQWKYKLMVAEADLAIALARSKAADDEARMAMHLDAVSEELLPGLHSPDPKPGHVFGAALVVYWLVFVIIMFSGCLTIENGVLVNRCGLFQWATGKPMLVKIGSERFTIGDETYVKQESALSMFDHFWGMRSIHGDGRPIMAVCKGPPEDERCEDVRMWCAGPAPCTVKKMYDQVGSMDMTQPSFSERPRLSADGSLYMKGGVKAESEPSLKIDCVSGCGGATFTTLPNITSGTSINVVSVQGTSSMPAPAPMCGPSQHPVWASPVKSGASYTNSDGGLTFQAYNAGPSDAYISVCVSQR